MKAVNSMVRAVLVVWVLAALIAGCASSRTQESTGQYVDDSAITAKVKAAMLEDPGLKSLQVGVETYKGTVQLSGFVNSPEMRNRAATVASRVNGVKSVKNDLVVK